MMHQSGEPHPISVLFSEGIMEEGTHTIAGGARRNEDIALDMMKFIALTTGYGKTAGGGGGAGFGTAAAASKPDEYAQHLLELYGKCLSAVHGKK
jgi:hypothetical protein